MEAKDRRRKIYEYIDEASNKSKALHGPIEEFVLCLLDVAAIALASQCDSKNEMDSCLKGLNVYLLNNYEAYKRKLNEFQSDLAKSEILKKKGALN